MDFLDRIMDYIELNVDLYTTFRVNLLGDGNSIAIRPTPSTPPERYMEGSKTYTYQFQILTQHERPLTAYNTLQAITDGIDGLTNGAITSSDGSFIFEKCEVYTTPNFIERGNSGHIYAAMFQAELYITKEA